MKRYLILLFFLSALSYSYAYDMECDGIFYNIISEETQTCEVTYSGNLKYTGYIRIPEYVTKDDKRYSVTAIGKNAFISCSQLEKIDIPSSLKIIGEEACRDCISLSDVFFEEGLEEIGKYAFYGCSGISKISTPSSLISIGEYAFYKCSNLSELNIANGLQSIGNMAFCGCNSITSLKIPDSVISIGESAFTEPWASSKGDYKLNMVQIGNGIKEIYRVFGGTNLEGPQIDSLVLGNSITRVHDTSSVFGSKTTTSSNSPVLYLLTNNIVSISSLSYKKIEQYTYGIPTCTVYVADATKYNSTQIDIYGIKNIVSTSAYKGEYSGTIPDINFVSYLEGYNATISKECYNVGTYSSMEVNFSKDDFSSTITVPCNYTITKAPLNIIANDKAIVYGEEIPELDCSYIGLKNGETADYALSTFPSLVTSAKKGSDAGTYKINISGAMSKNCKHSINYRY